MKNFEKVCTLIRKARVRGDRISYHCTERQLNNCHAFLLLPPRELTNNCAFTTSFLMHYSLEAAAVAAK